MMALSIHQPWASLIATGLKTIETRSRRTTYRGDLLICATKLPIVAPYPNGMAICIVSLVNCIKAPEWPEDESPLLGRSLRDEFRQLYWDYWDMAQCDPYYPSYGYILENIRPIKPFPVKGKQGFFKVDYPGETR